MNRQTNLVQDLSQKYVIDACAILDFWGSVNSYRRVYDIEVASFRALWNHIENNISAGIIILPEVIYKEVDKTTNEELHKWLLKNKDLFVDYDDVKEELAEIVGKINIYTTPKGSLHDAILVAIAKHRGLTVITSEKRSEHLILTKPKIPNVCEEMNVNWISLPSYFKLEGL